MRRHQATSMSGPMVKIKKQAKVETVSNVTTTTAQHEEPLDEAS